MKATRQFTKKIIQMILLTLCAVIATTQAQTNTPKEAPPKTPQEAIVFFTDMMKTHPDIAAEAFYGRGLAYRDLGEVKKAVADISKAIELKPTYAEAYIDRGIIYHDMMNNNDLAVSDYSQAIRLKSTYADAYNNRGNAFNDKGMYDKAIADFSQAIELSSGDKGAAYYGRATSYFYKKDYDKSWDDLHKAEVLLGSRTPPELKEALKKASRRER